MEILRLIRNHLFHTHHKLRETSSERLYDTAPKSLSDVSRSHMRSDSSSSITSFDAVFDESKNHRSQSHKRNASTDSWDDILEDPLESMSNRRESTNTRKRSVKRDLELILGHDDHLLVQRIISENKEMFKETELELSPEEKILVQRISDACRTGIEVNCSEILKIVSHQTAAVM